MLPPRCSSPPCMNIDVRMVSQVDGWSEASPPHTSCSVPLAVLAGVAHLVWDRAVVHHLLVELGLVAERTLEEEEHQHVGGDQRDREVREAAGGDVVLEREHSAHVEELEGVGEVKAGSGPALDGVYAVATRHSSQPVTRRAHVRQRAPPALGGVEQLHLRDRLAGAEVLAAEHHDPPAG